MNSIEMVHPRSKTRKEILNLLLYLAIGAVGAFGQGLSTFSGVWVNELESKFIIDSISNHGEVQGMYQSSSGVDGRTFPLQGWVNSIPDTKVVAISFTVRWDGYGSITSWTGYLDRDAQGYYIKTLWHLIRPGEKEAWERIITNSSIFRRLDKV